jgi:putative endonuclease
MDAYMYILKCANDTFYVGSTKCLELRINQHQEGKGSNYTRKHLPVKLVYYEEFDRIDLAFQREKQVQKWSHAKKEALINRDIAKLKSLAISKSSPSTPLGELPSTPLGDHASTQIEEI